MAEPFLGEIRMMAFNYAPTTQGWAMCNGQLLPINQNQALFSLLGTNFGGNGSTNFALPDMRGQTPIHVGPGFTLGQKAGEQAHTLTISELPSHVHVANGTSAPADQPVRGANLLGAVDVTAFTTSLYAPAANLVAMAPATVGNIGGSQAHLNMQPFLVITFAIALLGIFPSPN